ncbi:MAG: hypothetical protein J6D37_01250 [Clostridia bacterium]|nr:hypothetical protein [Clostridia bacterium]
MDKNITYTVKDVTISLEYGPRISTLGVIIAWMILIVGIFLDVFPFCGIIPFDTDESINPILCLIFLSAFIMLFAGYFLVREYRLNQKIDLWLQDAVRLEAQCSKMGSWRGTNAGTGYNVTVTFCYDDKQRTADGFGLVYKNYAGRVVDILYSPKYDQVMMLRLPKKRK